MSWIRKFVPAVLALLLALTVAAPSTSADTLAGKKKGASINNTPGVSQALKDVRAGWFYDWAADLQGVTKPSGIEFVPMMWGKGSVTQQNLNKAKSLGKTLLGFNEPDHGGQANMSPDQALGLWPKLQSTGMRLGAPAVAANADKAGSWLDTFMRGAASRKYKVDFIPVHWYGGDFSDAAVGQLRRYLEAVHNRYHKPIWLTEYALTDFGHGAPRYPSAAQQAKFVKNSTAMLQGLSFVERYAWFTLSTKTAPTGLYNGTKPNASGAAYRAAG
ncbi:glycoside hydrolase family protein [Amycolatopsis jejuensis]|uniref:glycoside hydrolase family protein n=1 Tax=Amycolatopsis jejuensis TaxID=330084 RepID=UPI0005244663|nr:glycoside hydrolase family protein [Amycolatopsis jejuensis]